MKKLLPLLAFMFPTLVFAQWRIGTNVGATYNHFTADKHYMIDYDYKDRWGLGLGVMGQYDVTDWLGVRAELNFMQKNHTVQRSQVSVQYKYTNNYLVLPVMASFSFGGQKLRGFCNLGVYGGYWLSSHREGIDYNSFQNLSYGFSEKMDIDSDHDQRLDCGLLGGIGMEYRFAKKWGAQVEVRYYYSVTSVEKEYMRVKDPKYNSTLALQAGVMYFF